MFFKYIIRVYKVLFYAMLQIFIMLRPILTEKVDLKIKKNYITRIDYEQKIKCFKNNKFLKLSF